MHPKEVDVHISLNKAHRNKLTTNEAALRIEICNKSTKIEHKPSPTPYCNYW